MKFNFSIRKKIMIAAISCVLISLSMSGVFFIYTQYKTLKNEAYERMNSSIDQVSTAISTKLTHINNSSFSFLSTDNIRKWANCELDFSSNLSQYKLRNEIDSDIMFNNAWISKYINTIYLFADGQTVPLATRYPSTLTILNAQFERIHKETKENKLMKFLYVDQKQYPQQVYMIHKMYNLSYKKYLTIIFHLNDVAISKELYQVGNNSNVNVTWKDKIVFSNSPSEIGNNSDLINQQMSSNRYFTVSRELDYPDFNIYISINNKDIMKPIYSSIYAYIGVIITLILIFGFTAGLFASGYTRFIQDLNNGILKIRNSNFNATMPVYHDHELNNISNTFNSMSGEIKRLIDTVYKSELLLKEADIKLLQSQINPHFLINTLTTIGTKAMLSGDKETYNMTNALCNMLDAGIYNTREQSSFITIEKELEYIKCYLYLQQIRFQDKLSYHIEISDDKLKKCYIPRLSIEPFVENSVVHGIENNPNQGFISVMIDKTKDGILATIMDNGIGMDVKEVMKRKSPQNGRGHHIGIANTNKRLKLLFGDQYGVSFESEPNVKTCAYIKLPILINQPESTENKG